MTRLSMLIVLVAFLSCSSAATIEGAQSKVTVKSVSRTETKYTLDTSGFSINLQEGETGDPRVDVVLSINDEVDGLLTSISTSLAASTVTLPDQEITFEYRPLLVTYIGTLTLTQGSLQGLSAVSRNGDAVMLDTVGSDKEEVTIPIIFEELIATYHFSMELRGDTIEGTIEAYLDDVTGTYHLIVENRAVTTEELDLETGSVTIDVNSSNLSILLYPNLVEEVSEDAVESSTEEVVVDIIGDAIGSAVKSELGVRE